MKTGTVYAWIIVLMVGWMATFLWIIFATIIVENVYPWADAQITDGTDAQETLDQQLTYWNAWPIILMAGLTVYGFASSLRQEPTSGYVTA